MTQDSELVLVLAPTENDSSVAARVLQEAGLHAKPCENIRVLCEEMRTGCALIVIAEEALPTEELHLLQDVLNNQEAWSDIPVILLTGEGPANAWESFSASGNISILERPFSRLTLIRAVEVGLRARRKQYQVADLLKQQNRAAQIRDEFFAALSHELRTPLNVILGWIEILRMGGLNKLKQEDALSIVERNARIQKALIDDLLDTSRIITGKLHFEMLPISLNQLLYSMQDDFTPRAAAKNIKMELHVPVEECLVEADMQRLSQVITNLLTNSIKFTPEGGMIAMDLSKRGNDFLISVKDTGQGIDPSFLPHVFDRLKQEDMSITRTHGGLGLGLSIAAHIMQQHKGKIVAKSEGRGKGSEFTITIPAMLKPASQLQLPLDDSFVVANSLKGVRVLVVDDSIDNLELINLWLKRAKAEVKLTHSAAEALREFSNYEPDILLSDIGMPEMDGYELITHIRNQKEPKIRDVKAIAVTAYAKDEERTQALNAGFQRHISKPISYQRLISTISQLTKSNELN